MNLLIYFSISNGNFSFLSSSILVACTQIGSGACFIRVAGPETMSMSAYGGPGFGGISFIPGRLIAVSKSSCYVLPHGLFLV